MEGVYCGCWDCFGYHNDPNCSDTRNINISLFLNMSRNKELIRLSGLWYHGWQMKLCIWYNNGKRKIRILNIWLKVLVTKILLALNISWMWSSLKRMSVKFIIPLNDWTDASHLQFSQTQALLTCGTLAYSQSCSGNCLREAALVSGRLLNTVLIV